MARRARSTSRPAAPQVRAYFVSGGREKPEDHGIQIKVGRGHGGALPSEGDMSMRTNAHGVAEVYISREEVAEGRWVAWLTGLGPRRKEYEIELTTVRTTDNVEMQRGLKQTESQLVEAEAHSERTGKLVEHMASWGSLLLDRSEGLQKAQDAGKTDGGRVRAPAAASPGRGSSRHLKRSDSEYDRCELLARVDRMRACLPDPASHPIVRPAPARPGPVATSGRQA